MAMRGRWAAAGLAVTLGLAGCVSTHQSGAPNPGVTSNSGVLSQSNNTTHPPADDVTITTCKVDVIDPTYDNTGNPEADLTITNHSSKPSDYDIQVGFFNQAGTRVDDGYTFETNVLPGQTADSSAGGTTTQPGGTPITCRLVSVDRTASGG